MSAARTYYEVSECMGEVRDTAWGYIKGIVTYNPVETVSRSNNKRSEYFYTIQYN